MLQVHILWFAFWNHCFLLLLLLLFTGFQLNLMLLSVHGKDGLWNRLMIYISFAYKVEASLIKLTCFLPAWLNPGGLPGFHLELPSLDTAECSGPWPTESRRTGFHLSLLVLTEKDGFLVLHADITFHICRYSEAVPAIMKTNGPLRSRK